MKRVGIGVLFLMGCIWSVTASFGQDIYELRTLSNDDWLKMSTEERMRSLGAAVRQAPNQTFVGQFNQFSDLYPEWGDEYYEMEDGYENLAFRGFDPYNIIDERRQRYSYNDFGDRIPRMRFTGVIWNEEYRGNKTYSNQLPDGLGGHNDVGSHVVPNRFINAVSEGNNVDGIWLARESTDSWALSVIGAGALRTKVSPLTFSLPNLEGMEIDFQSENHQAKFISAKIVGRVVGGDYRERGALMMRAGHFRKKFGLLTLGANYANVYGIQANRENGGSWRGTMSSYTATPMTYYVRFLDDSPNDNEAGALVSSVRLRINGRVREDIVPVVIRDDTTRDRVTIVTDPNKRDYLNNRIVSLTGGSPPAEDNLSNGAQSPKNGDYIFLMERMRGINTSTVSSSINVNLLHEYYHVDNPYEYPKSVRGTESLVYIFELNGLTEKLQRVQVEAKVANDYRIETATQFSNTGGDDTAGDSIGKYSVSYWNTSAQAEGNVKDGSNVRTVQLDFGVQVANVIYGVDMDFNFRGFKIRGEYTTNAQHYQFPGGLAGQGWPGPGEVIEAQAAREGQQYSVFDDAYYVIAQKDWEQFGFSAEVFKMGKFWRPYLDWYYPFPDKEWGFGSINTRNYIARVSLIEDNDDDDQYPDTMLMQRSMGHTIIQNDDPDGVFPGNDEDHDGLPDSNKNNNSVADYDEPFLMFDIDPDEFVFGEDFNNNMIPDFREDDLKYDTPYDLDRKGYHLIGRYSPAQGVNVITGSLRSEGVGSSTRTYDDYVKLQVNYGVFDIGQIFAEYRHEKIQDNIRDVYLQVNKNMIANYASGRGLSGRYDRQLYYDEMYYRNSVVDRIFLEAVIRAVPSIMIENHVKYESNAQQEGTMYDGSYQPADTIGLIALTSKITYTKKFGNFTLSPGMKYRLYKRARSGSVQPYDHYLMQIPLLMMWYDVSLRTTIKLGMQGLPGLEYTLNDYVQDHNDSNQKIYTLQVSNWTDYFGYTVWSSAGFTIDHLNYDKPNRKLEEYNTSYFFVKVYLGW